MKRAITKFMMDNTYRGISIFITEYLPDYIRKDGLIDKIMFTVDKQPFVYGVKAPYNYIGQLIANAIEEKVKPKNNQIDLVIYMGGVCVIICIPLDSQSDKCIKPLDQYFFVGLSQSRREMFWLDDTVEFAGLNFIPMNNLNQ